jgi:PAS domain S-box-containing protein
LQRYRSRPTAGALLEVMFATNDILPAQAPPPAPAAQLQILHLEDDDADAELVQANLRADGLACQIHRAVNRATFEQALDARAYDAIISDYALPDYDGLSAMKLVRARWPFVPFILVSGTLGEEQAVESLKCGASDYVMKARLMRLPTAVRRALQEAEMHRHCHRAEAQLKQSHDLFRQITENIEDLVAVLDRTGRRVFSSPSYGRLLGAQAQAPGANSFHEIHPDDAPRIRRVFAETVATGVGQRAEYRFVLPDGSIRHIESQGSVIRDDGGQIINVLVVSRDIPERRRAGELLRLQEAALHAAANIVVITNRTGAIEWTNPAFTKTTGYTADEVRGQNPRVLKNVAAAATHPPDYYQTMWRTITSGAVWQGEFENQRKDGTPLIEEATITPVCNEQGDITHFVAVKQDITERKQAEARLADAQHKLVELSRRAGMAEVATGVLHNVGNVLNSVNVGASCLADAWRHSKLASVSRVATLLRDHKANLADFLASDPKGRQVPDYLTKLAEHLASEQAGALHELAQLQKHIEHIKDIVAMQQNLAQVSGLAEPVQLAELLEDALLMAHNAVVRVEKDFTAVPPVTVQKHKVLQVLVNLLHNAQHACEDSGRADKKIVLCLRQQGERVCLTVTDNGVGIPAENLTRIFGHGFTTKKNGHGFGLHSGALAMQEMGGTLQAQSAGVDQGATFTLELPIQPAIREAA